jgi:putative pyruvate formate lyase activating enzyme
VVPQVIEAIAAAIPLGLRLPIVYNTSAYDSVSSLRLLDGLIDIYMPDFKFWTKESAMRLAKAKDYPERARQAVAEMHRQVGDLTFDDRGLAVRGLLVRHLVMPNQTDEAAAIFEFLADLSPDTYVNIMGQYGPQYEVGSVVTKGAKKGEIKYESINRSPTRDEMRAARAAAQRAGLHRFDHRRLIELG